MHNAAFAALGLPHSYENIEPQDLEEIIDKMRCGSLAGVSVTHPYKKQVIHYLDDVDEAAAACRAVNTIVRDGEKLSGFNTDVFGATRALNESNQNSFRNVVLLGAGGAARAVARALAKFSVEKLVVYKRSRTEFHLETELPYQVEVRSWPAGAIEEPADLLVNATPELNLAGKVKLATRCAFDLIPGETWLIREAKRLGINTATGQQMLLYQALEQSRLFTGHLAPRAVMQQALSSAL